nr:probable galacturonosyltransferase 10 [Ipomoea batatas]
MTERDWEEGLEWMRRWNLLMLGCSKVMLHSGCLPTTKISSNSFSNSSEKAGLSSRKMFLRMALFFNCKHSKGMPMRRRSFDLRNRPAKRRYSKLGWLLLFAFLTFLFFTLFRHKNPSPSTPSLLQGYNRQSKILEGLNVTEEMLSPYSVTRQINDQISLAKALVIIARESNNLQLAWEISAKIRKSQVLLSTSATRKTPLTMKESEAVIRDMALLICQAQQLHYDSATMIMRLKANIQSLDEQLGTLPPGLLTFYGLTHALDPSWHVLGLGYTNVDSQLLEKGAVLHFNGNSKPWLKIGMEKYKPLWNKYEWAIDYHEYGIG